MSKEKKTNGKAFQSKLTIEQLRTEVLMNKLSADEICKKYSIRPYTLQSKLYEAALTASNKNESLKFILDIPNEVEYTAQRKSKGIHISKALCDYEQIPENQKFNLEFNKMKEGKSIVLTPVS